MGRGLVARVGRGLLAVCCVLVGLVVVVAPASRAAAAQPLSSVGSAFFGGGVSRLMDTRIGLNTQDRPVGPNQTISLQLAGLAVPLNWVTAVTLNITVVSPTAATYLTVYGDQGVGRPLASTLNVPASGQASNLVTVPGTDVAFYNHAGSIDVVADFVGYYTNAPSSLDSVYSGLAPSRVLDTRDGTGGHLGRVGPASSVSIQATGQHGVPATGVKDVVLNLTVVNPSTAGYVVAYPNGYSPPYASNLEFVAGETVPNLVIAPVGKGGRTSIYNANGTVDLVADVVGYFTRTGVSRSLDDGFGTDGGLFNALGPTRVLDTRDGTGTGTTVPVAADHAISVPIAGRAGVPADATAVALNVTATDATATTYVTVYPGGASRPVASNLNVPAKATIANDVVVPIGPDGTITLYNHAGSVNLVADLAGYYTTGATSPWHTAAAPLPPGAPAGSDVTLAGVACAGPDGCVATGAVTSSAQSAGLLLTGAGTAWTAVSAPLPPDAANPPSVVLGAPVCPSSGSCLVLGQYQTTAGTTADVVLRGWGSTWTASRLPTLPGTTLTGDRHLACGPTGCTVLGSYTDGTGATRLELITGDPTTDASAWIPLDAPAPTGTVTAALSVGCGPAACTALGTYTDATGVPRPYLITGSGTTWSETDAPLPAGDSTPDGQDNAYQLDTVFCGPTACTVTGHHQAGANLEPVLLTGDGSTWTATNAPQPADAGVAEAVTFDSVACPTTNQCAATGHYTTTTGQTAAVLLTGSPSTTWTESALTGPDGTAGRNNAFALACPTTSSCLTAGGYQDMWGINQLATGSGTPTSSSWPQSKATPPPNAHLTNGDTPPLHLACGSSALCVAAGTYTDNTGHTQGFLLTR